MLAHLVFLNEVVHIDSDVVWPALALCGSLAKVNPSDRGKVGGLCTVEASVEARVVAIGEGDDEVACLLGHLQRCIHTRPCLRGGYLVDWDRVLPEN